MDIYKQLILLKGKDKTRNVSKIYDNGNYMTIIFTDGGKFNYGARNVEVIYIRKIIDIKDDTIVKINDKKVKNVDKILDFNKYYKIIYKTKKATPIYNKSEVKIYENSLNSSNNEFTKRFYYFKGVSSALSLTVNEEFNILGSQYNKIEALYDNCVLQRYLSAPEQEDIKIKSKNKNLLIYPFGINLSQKQAVENSFSSKVSIIQGPPGTGKTQTILNILANAIMNDKTIAVASNNNTAIENVLDKLKSYDLDFLCALLGSGENKEAFINNQEFNQYPKDLDSWDLGISNRLTIRNSIKNIIKKITTVLEAQNNVAALNLELSELKKEQKHFIKHSSKLFTKSDFTKKLNKLSSTKLMNLKFIYEDYSNSNVFKKQLIKLKTYLTYGFFVKPLFLENNDDEISLLLLETNKIYYEKRIKEIEEELDSLNLLLEKNDSKELMNSLQVLSLKLFKDKLYSKYSERNDSRRQTFSLYNLRSKSKKFVDEYPIVLSTTYSLKSSLNSNFLYDYLIVDEASQVDLGTGVIAMSCAKNMVVVGDLKQLPNVVTSSDARIADGYWNPSFPSYYNFSRESLLSSLNKAFKDAPSTMLREHYRCAPDIINFCNQRFYDNQLIIMSTGSKDVKDEKNSSLTLYKTVEGNHARSRFNQREVDVIKEEVLPSLDNIDYKDIGIIAPYNMQVDLLRKELSPSIEIDTVHKFQGREKKVIIISTVDNDLHGEFSNNPNLINVAISRAKEKLIVVTSSNKENKDTIYGDLCAYITYNNFEVVDSNICSVFDMLYKRNFEERCKYLKNSKKISEFDSENIMYKTIQGILKDNGHNNKDVVAHIPLHNLVNNYDIFNNEEKRYVSCPLTHLDFLIYNKLTKEPLLAIEVDGYAFHKKGTKQHSRDLIKNSALEKLGLPLLRLSTTGSNEEEQIISHL